MQRRDDQGVTIVCDFCGTDWDQVRPMIEGHEGSVICLECTKTALGEVKTQAHRYDCALCLRSQLPEDVPRWRPLSQPGANPNAIICRECLDQAVRAFDRDPDVNWSKPQ